MAKETTPPAETTPPTPPTKEETPSWGKTLLETVTSLGDRLTNLEKAKETEKPTVQIPLPPKPQGTPPAETPPGQTPQATPPAAKKSILDYLW